MDEKEMTEAAISGVVSGLLDSMSSAFHGLGSEIKAFLKIGLRDYLAKQASRYSSGKTFLHRSAPIYLYDYYEPLYLVDPLGDIVGTQSVTGLFSSNRCITVIGDAGSGKSTLVKHLFLQTIKEHFAIPVLVELRYVNDFKGDLETYIRSTLFDGEKAANERLFERLLESGKFLFFLDGYDELGERSKHNIAIEIVTLATLYNTNHFVTTSRPYAGIEMLPQFVNFGVAAFTDDQVSSFVRKQIKEEELAGKILKSIEEEKAEEVRSFVSNPLLLSLYILTFRTNSTIPDKKHLFYRRVYDVLFSEHDTLSKLGYERERKTGLTQEQFQDVLERISFLAFFDGRFSFSRDYTYGLLKHVKAALGLAFENADLLDDLKTAIGIWTEDGGEFSFAHRSMQEYFGACFIKGLKDALKQEIYAKINEKLEQRVGLGNFLSLCAEMDTIAYHEFLMLPALQAVDRRVASARERPIAAASLLFESIILDDNLKIEGFIITRAAGVYITILNFDLTSMSNAMICLSHDRRFQQWVIETNSTTAVKFADLSEQKKQEADDILRKDTLAMREIDSFLSQVTHKIDETKQLLQNVDSNNRKFIDMI